jgi:hypothetical protein
LIGESLVKQENISQAVRNLFPALWSPKDLGGIAAKFD